MIWLDNHSVRRPLRRRWRGPFVLIVVAALLVWGGSRLLRPLESVALGISGGPVSFRERFVMGTRRLLTAAQTKQALEAANRELSSDLMEARAKMATYEAVMADYEALRLAAGFRASRPAGIVAHNRSNLWANSLNTLALELPATVVVEGGERVIFGGSLWLGTVVSQSGQTVKTRLLSTPGTEIPVVVGPTGIPALARGSGGGNFQLTLPRNLAIEVGDWVLAAGEEWPLAIGVVGAVEKDPAESLQKVWLRAPVNLHYLRYVEIIPA